MRLIDADKIRYRDMSGGSVPNGVWYTFLDDVEKIPTVKAIPIEWIEEWGWKNGMSESMSLRVMIDDWEKDNGRD